MRLQPSNNHARASLLYFSLALSPVVFVLEMAILLFFPLSHPASPHLFVGATAAAALVVSVCVSYLWWLFLRPLKASLERETAKLAAVMDAAAEGIVTIDARGAILSFNRAAENIFGYEAHEVIGRNVRMLMPSPHRERHDEYIARCLRTGTPGIPRAGREVEGLRKNGARFPMELAISDVHLGSQRLFAGIVRDIGERKRIEHDLRGANELLERIFSNVQVLVAYLDADFNFIRVNRAYAAADGKEPDDFVGKNHFALYPDLENRAIFRHVVETGEPYVAYAKPFVYPANPERGVSYWDWTVQPVRGAGGRVEGILLTLLDVSERRRAEESRRQSEAKFQTLFDSVGDAIFIHDFEGHFLEVNRAACERLGYSRDELLRVTPMQIDAPDYAAKVPERIGELIRTGHALFEAVHLHRDGTPIPVEIDSRLVTYEGQPAILSVARDISRRKATERTLRESGENARALLDANTETALLARADGTVLAINQTGAARLKATPAELVGRSVYDLLPPDLAEERRQKIEEALRTGEPVRFEDGCNGLVFENAVHPVTDANGQVVRIAVYAADITERRQIQAVDAMLRNIDQYILQGRDLEELPRFVCAQLVELLGFPLAWIGRKKTDGAVALVACAGSTPDYQKELACAGLRWDDRGQGPAAMAIRSGKPQRVACADPDFWPWRGSDLHRDLQSGIALPLVIHGETNGALNLYSGIGTAFDDPGTLQRLTSIADRISIALEMARDQQQLRLLSAALASAGNAVFITDRNGDIQWLNNAFTRLSGYSFDEVIGQNPRFLKSGKQPPEYYQHLWGTLLRGDGWCSETVERRKDGDLYTVQQTITPIRNERGEITHFISIHEDITAKKETEVRIAHMAHYDGLTDLPNRALFYDRLRQTLRLAKRNRHACALLFLDLDRFKEINDTYGHATGDLFLQAVAKRLKAAVRESDTVARLAGDEFTVILPRLDNRADAALVAEKIVASLSSPFDIEGREIRAGASIGIALYPDDADDEDTLVKLADAAMYQAKTQGRNAYRFYSGEKQTVV